MWNKMGLKCNLITSYFTLNDNELTTKYFYSVWSEHFEMIPMGEDAMRKSQKGNIINTCVVSIDKEPTIPLLSSKN